MDYRFNLTRMTSCGNLRAILDEPTFRLPTLPAKGSYIYGEQGLYYIEDMHIDPTDTHEDEGFVPVTLIVLHEDEVDPTKPPAWLTPLWEKIGEAL